MHGLFWTACWWSVVGLADSTIVDELGELRAKQPDQAIARIEALLNQSNADENARLRADLLRLAAEIQRDRAVYGESTRWAEAFLEQAKALADPGLETEALFLLGTIAAEQTQISTALELFHSAREQLERLDRPAELARVYSAIGVAHVFSKDYQRAEPYFESALELARRAGDRAMESTVLGNLAIAASQTQGPEHSARLHQQALDIARAEGLPQQVTLQLANLCDRLVEAGRLDSAEMNCPAALQRVRELDHPRYLAGTLMANGDLAWARQRNEQALAFYQEALEVASGRVAHVESDLLRKLADVSEQLGDWPRASAYLRQRQALREKMAAGEGRTAVEEIEARYQFERQKGELEVLRLQAELDEVRLRRRTVLLISLSAVLVLMTALAFVAWRGYRIERRLEHQLHERNRELEQALRRIGQMASSDSLTGLLNRRSLEAAAKRELKRAHRLDLNAVVAMADIDHFKQLNDGFGHPVGDQVLMVVAKRLLGCLRESDLVSRWGGEEFLCLLVDVDLEQARSLAERVRLDLARPVATSAGELQITVTFGLAPVSGDLDQAIRSADEAMYLGKRAGRNRVVAAGDPASGRD